MIQVIRGPEDAAELQASLDKMCEWADMWGMSFNVAKCKIMHVGARNPNHIYTMNGIQLTRSESERDIGVTVSSNLKPAQQCRKAAGTAVAVLGQITRAYHYRDRHIYLNLYKQYVRPHLEFAVPAWAPWTQADVQCLEHVQERAVKAISGLKGTTYEEKLVEVGLPSLKDRRTEFDMVQTFKLVNNVDTDNSDKWFERSDNRRLTRNGGGTDNLVVKRSRHEFRKNFFTVRVIEGWNRLPNAVKEAWTVHGFKSLYRRHNRDVVAPAPPSRT